MIRVLHITDKPPGGGGIRRIVESYMEFASSRSLSAQLFRVVLPGDTPGSDSLSAPLATVRGPMVSGSELDRALGEADIVHLHLGFSWLTGNLVSTLGARADLVVSVHDVAPFLTPRLIGTTRPGRPELAGAHAFRLLLRRPFHRAAWTSIAREARRVLVPSGYVKRLCLRAGLSEGRVHLLPHPAPRVAAMPTAAPSDCPPDIVYAGLLAPSKGVSVLLDAVRATTACDMRLILLGDGPSRREAEALAAAPAFAGRVLLRGKTCPVEVLAAMAAARAVVHPALFPESFGLTGVEAMAMGRPVAGFGFGGTSDWLRDGQTGLCVRPADSDSLARALDRLVRDPDLADALGAGARRAAERDYDRDMIGDRLAGLYRACLEAA